MSVRYGISQRIDGTVLVATGGQLFSAGQQHRAAFLAKEGIPHYVVCQLVHGTEIKKVTMADDKTIVWKCDGLVTTEPNLFLCLTVADCIPCWLWDEERGAVGIAHAGWRGAAAGIATHLVEAMRREFGCKPENFQAALGPSIQSCHFEVKEDVVEKFSAYRSQVRERDGKMFLDLPGVVQQQFTEVGVPPSSIARSSECTYCLPDKYFSYRRDRSNPIEVMLAYIGRTPQK